VGGEAGHTVRTHRGSTRAVFEAVCCLTIAHKLQAEAPLGKLSLAGRGFWTPRGPMAES